MLMWQRARPTAQVGTPNVDDGVLVVGLDHDSCMTYRCQSDHDKIIEANPATAEARRNESPVSVIPDLLDEVNQVRELGGACGRVGSLAGNKRLPGPRHQGLTLAQELVYLDVDVGIGRPHHHHQWQLRWVQRETWDFEIIIMEKEVLNWSNGAEECGLSVGVETVMWWC